VDSRCERALPSLSTGCTRTFSFKSGLCGSEGTRHLRIAIDDDPILLHQSISGIRDLIKLSTHLQQTAARTK
jgi:hypothetical protein